MEHVYIQRISFDFPIYLRKPSMTSLQRVNCVAAVAESPALELVLLLVLLVR